MAKLFIDRCEIASRSTWFYALMSKAPVEIYEFNERNEELEMENPMRIVPFLMDSDVKLWGSQACILYMAEKYGNFEGFGKSHDERARLESLLSWASNSLLRNVAQDYVVPKLYEEEGLDGKSKEVLIENGELSVNKQLDVIESMYLKKSKYLSGDEKVRPLQDFDTLDVFS